MSKLTLPTYTTIQPSTGLTVEYRPFTVREEKSLLLALESGDMKNIGTAIKNCISTCTMGVLDPTKVPYYDVEWLFLQIRGKSVGEVIDLIGNCDCGERTEFSVSVEDTKINPAPSKDNLIAVTDTIYSLKMQHPNLDGMIAQQTSGGEDSANVVADCILGVYTADEICDWSKTEREEFVLDMTPRMQKPVADFLRVMPQVQLDVGYTCKSCGKVHENIMSGFENFFV